jgi:hypothetical protein
MNQTAQATRQAQRPAIQKSGMVGLKVLETVSKGLSLCLCAVIFDAPRCVMGVVRPPGFRQAELQPGDLIIPLSRLHQKSISRTLQGLSLHLVGCSGVDPTAPLEGDDLDQAIHLAGLGGKVRAQSFALVQHAGVDLGLRRLGLGFLGLMLSHSRI